MLLLSTVFIGNNTLTVYSARRIAVIKSPQNMSSIWKLRLRNVAEHYSNNALFAIKRIQVGLIVYVKTIRCQVWSRDSHFQDNQFNETNILALKVVKESKDGGGQFILCCTTSTRRRWFMDVLNRGLLDCA